MTAEAGINDADMMVSIPTLDAKTRTVLADFLPVVEAHLDDIVDEFLNYATAWRELPAVDRSPQSTIHGARFESQLTCDPLQGPPQAIPPVHHLL